MFNDNNKNISQSLKQETERSTETFKILKDMTTAIDKKQKKSSQESAAGREIYGQLSVQLKQIGERQTKLAADNSQTHQNSNAISAKMNEIVVQLGVDMDKKFHDLGARLTIAETNVARAQNEFRKISRI